jgi:hypothetical protein
MKKLEDIPKKNIYKVPDGYFEQLPGVIQSRVTKGETSEKPFFLYSFRYASLIMLIVVAALVWFWKNQRTPDLNAEQMLAAIDTPTLIAYLEETDLTTDELLESVPLSQEEVNAIENDVYDIALDENDLDALIDEYSFELNDF